MKKLILTMIILAGCTKTIYVDRYIVPPCVKPEKPIPTATVQVTDEEITAVDKCLKTAECSARDVYVLNEILKAYAGKLLSEQTYSQKWEAYGECINKIINKEKEKE